MFQLLRRISGTFTRRFDWDQDGSAKSTEADAPRVGSKRRMSDDDDDVVGSLSKRSRKQDNDAEQDGASEGTTSVPPTPVLGPTSGKETEEVKEVTKGVKEVELEDKETTQTQIEDADEEATAADEQAPESTSAALEMEEGDEDAPAEEETEEDGEVYETTEEIIAKKVPSSSDVVKSEVEPPATSTLEDVTDSSAPKSNALDSNEAEIHSDEATVTSETPLPSEDAPATPETPAKLQ